MRKITFLFAFLFVFYAQGQDYLPLETFDSGLGAWTTMDAGDATGDTWITGLQDGTESLNGSDVAFVDSDANGNGVAMLETLMSPVFDSSAGTVVLLEFDQYYNDAGAGDDTASVEVWDGAAWQQVLLLDADTGDFGAPDEQSIDITAFKNPNMQVRFVYDDGNLWAWYWLIDNVRVREQPTCTEVVVASTSIVNDCPNSEFSIDVDVTTVGDGAFINDGTNTFPIVAGSNVVGPYASGTTVTLAIEHTDPNCDYVLPDVDFTCPTIPTVEGMLAINGCLDSDSFTTAFEGVSQSFYWLQLDYDGGCFRVDFDTAGSDFDTELGLYDINGFLVANNDDDIGGITPQSAFDVMNLPAGTYYLATGEFNMEFGADNFNVTFAGTPNDTGTLIVNVSTPSDETVDFCNIQFPGTANIQTGDPLNVFAQVFEAGVTEPQGMQGAGIEAWIGFSETDATSLADFESADWTWVVADYNTAGPANNNDEYFTDIGTGRTEGTYYYVSRFSIDGGPFTYGGSDITDGDGGNFWDGVNFVSGVLTVTNPPPPANDLCENATVIACDDVLAGQTTIQATGGSATSCNGTIGDDVWYQLTGNDSEVTITVDASVQEGQIGVFESTDGTCAGFTLGNCIASVDDLGGNPTSVSFQATAGTEYFIQVGNWINGDPGLIFEISATCTTCPAPTNLDADNLTETSAELSWDENGTATEWNIEYGAPGFMLGSGTSVAGVSTNPYLLEGLTTETDYEYYVQAICGGENSDWSGPFAFSTLPPPPANDDCANATVLTPGALYETNPLDGSVAGATNDAEANSCGLNGPGVWYSVMVPADGNITIETGPDAATSDGAFDSVIEVFSGACGALTSIACDDDGAATGNFSILDLMGLTPGEIIYVRVWEYNGDEFEPFSISAYNSTLSTDDFDNPNAFTYFPNPVNDVLTLRSQSNIQNITVLNMLGQVVLRTAPNAIEDNVDMSVLNAGSYFVQVTINNVTETVRIVKD